MSVLFSLIFFFHRFIVKSTQFYKIQPRELHWSIEDRIAHVTNVFIDQTNYLFSAWAILNKS